MIDAQSESAVIPLRFGHTLSFGDLLRRASESADVAEGLALAYAGFEPSKRAVLLSLIEKEVADHPGRLALVMCHLLTEEQDAALVRAIAQAIARASALRPSHTDRAWVVKSSNGAGKALIGFGQASSRFNVYELQWDSDAITYASEHLDLSEPQMHTRAWTFVLTAQSASDAIVPVSEALDTICELLWRRRDKMGAYRGILAGFVEQFSL